MTRARLLFVVERIHARILFHFLIRAGQITPDPRRTRR